MTHRHLGVGAAHAERLWDAVQVSTGAASTVASSAGSATLADSSALGVKADIGVWLAALGLRAECEQQLRQEGVEDVEDLLTLVVDKSDFECVPKPPSSLVRLSCVTLFSLPHRMQARGRDCTARDTTLGRHAADVIPQASGIGGSYQETLSSERTLLP